MQDCRFSGPQDARGEQCQKEKLDKYTDLARVNWAFCRYPLPATLESKSFTGTCNALLTEVRMYMFI